MLFRLLLRASSLAAKFALTVAIARVLGLGAVGEYGMAIAFSVIASKLFGLGFSAELNRRLSGARGVDAIATARALRRVYAGFYCAAGLALAIAWRGGWLGAVSIGAQAWCLVFLIAVGEHYALEANGYVFSMHRPRAGSTLLFARTGGWAVIAIAGLMSGVIHSMTVVLALWLLTNVSVIVCAWALLERVERAASPGRSPVREPRALLLNTWKTGAPYYAGGVMMAGLQYAERFIASGSLPAAELGRYVFAWSVANAVQTITNACVGVTAGPKLARAAEESRVEWRKVFGRSMGHTAVISIAMGLCIGCASPLIFGLARQTVVEESFFTFAILLLSFVLRSLTDMLWAACIARRLRRRIVIGMSGAAIAALPVAAWLIAGRGQTGVALAHLAASVAVIFALVWALGASRNGGRQHA